MPLKKLKSNCTITRMRIGYTRRLFNIGNWTPIARV